MDAYTRISLECSKLTAINFNASFSRGVSLLPKEYQDAVYAIYGFVKFADEIADKYREQDKKDLIANFQRDTFEGIERQFSSNPILHSFQWAVNKYSIDEKQIRSYLRSLRLGLCTNSQSNFNNDVYIRYIYGSTELISLMCLKILARNTEEYRSLSPEAMKLAEAFQKINFLLDAKESVKEEGFFYLPDANYVTFDLKKKREIEKDIEKKFGEATEGLRQLPEDTWTALEEIFSYYRDKFQEIRSAD